MEKYLLKGHVLVCGVDKGAGCKFPVKIRVWQEKSANHRGCFNGNQFQALFLSLMCHYLATCYS